MSNHKLAMNNEEQSSLEKEIKSKYDVDKATHKAVEISLATIVLENSTADKKVVGFIIPKETDTNMKVAAAHKAGQDIAVNDEHAAAITIQQACDDTTFTVTASATTATAISTAIIMTNVTTLFDANITGIEVKAGAAIDLLLFKISNQSEWVCIGGDGGAQVKLEDCASQSTENFHITNISGETFLSHECGVVYKNYCHCIRISLLCTETAERRVVEWAANKNIAYTIQNSLAFYRKRYGKGACVENCPFSKAFNRGDVINFVLGHYNKSTITISRV